MACRVRPDKKAEYLRLHADVWPSVEATITACGIRNFTIFIRDDVLFGYFEYVAMTTLPTKRKWQQIRRLSGGGR